MKSLIEVKYIPMTLQNNTSPDIVTQWYFFECLTDELLNVLLYRASTSKLENDIIKRMEDDPNLQNEKDITVVTNVDISDSEDPYIIILFFEDNIQVCHLTIHLCPTSLSMYTKAPLHIVNNTYYRATQRLRIKRRNNNSIIISLGSLYNGTQTGDKAKQYTGYAIQVLNDYFNPRKRKYLLKSKLRNIKHPYLNTIRQKQDLAYTSLGKNNPIHKTRRNRK